MKTELDGYQGWGERRKEALQLLYESSVELPVQGSTSAWYNIAKQKRKELQLGSQVDDNDLWIIAHAREYDVPLITHDFDMAKVADAIGVEVLTLAPQATAIAPPDTQEGSSAEASPTRD